ncbi:hypothetical protein H4Q26_002078 [Puccinia striiformis f. sp. tritici PST-130]|nr:hypothetical protein H4Q26_002078 [Puccinia striiformis f. sp. tritici PST-130]
MNLFAWIAALCIVTGSGLVGQATLALFDHLLRTLLSLRIVLARISILIFKTPRYTSIIKSICPRYLNGTMAANLNAAAGIITAPANAGDAAEGIGATTEQSNQISLSPAEQAVYDRDMQPFVKNAIEAIPKLTLSNFTVWKANFETVTNLLQLTHILRSPALPFSTIQNLKVLSLITTRLDPAVHINVITPENMVDAKLLWIEINNHFAAVNPANRARIHAEFLDIVFDVTNIQGFEMEDEDLVVMEEELSKLAPVAEVEPRDDFHEDVPSAAASSNGDFHDCSSDEDVQLTPISTDSQAIPASSRVLRERTDKVKPLKYSHLTESVKKIASSDPKSFGKAINSPDGKAWGAAADEELNTHNSRQNGRTSSLGSRLFASSLDPVSQYYLLTSRHLIIALFDHLLRTLLSLRIVLARISILIFKTPRYTSIIKSICSGFGYKL